MSGRTSTDSTTIRHQQERDQAETVERSEAERARSSLVGTRGLGGILVDKPVGETEKALKRATDERGVKPGRGERGD